MSKQNLTPRQRAVYARNKAMGPAIILHPLRVIGYHGITISKNDKGELIKFISWSYRFARHAANKGDGAAVKAIARNLK